MQSEAISHIHKAKLCGNVKHVSREVSQHPCPAKNWRLYVLMEASLILQDTALQPKTQVSQPSAQPPH